MWASGERGSGLPAMELDLYVETSGSDELGQTGEGDSISCVGSNMLSSSDAADFRARGFPNRGAHPDKPHTEFAAFALKLDRYVPIRVGGRALVESSGFACTWLGSPEGWLCGSATPRRLDPNPESSTRR